MQRSKSNAPSLLRKWREKAKLTQTACAEEVGVSQPTWSEWEAGRADPRGRYMVAIDALTEGAVPVSAWLQEAERKKESA